jgi:hypothetical protein
VPDASTVTVTAKCCLELTLDFSRWEPSGHRTLNFLFVLQCISSAFRIVVDRARESSTSRGRCCASPVIGGGSRRDSASHSCAYALSSALREAEIESVLSQKKADGRNVVLQNDVSVRCLFLRRDPSLPESRSQ